LPRATRPECWQSSTASSTRAEAALIRLSRLGAVRPIEEVLEGLVRSPAPPAARRPEPGVAPGEKKKPVERSATAADLRSHLIAAVAAQRPLLAGILEQADAIEARAGEILIRMPAGMDAVGRQLERPDAASLLAACAADRVEDPVRVRVVSSTGPLPSSSGPMAVPSSRNSGGAPRPKARPPHTRQGSSDSTAGVARGSLIEKATSEPGVRKLLREFGAQVIDIRPLEPGDIVVVPDDPDVVEDGP
jgi:hypothetical protein